jgi:hypothetical protein
MHLFGFMYNKAFGDGAAIPIEAGMVEYQEKFPDHEYLLSIRRLSYPCLMSSHFSIPQQEPTKPIYTLYWN